MQHRGYSAIIYGCNDGSPAVDGVPINDFIEKFN